jgi:magnesium-transporting ATPase (P-type)
MVTVYVKGAPEEVLAICQEEVQGDKIKITNFAEQGGEDGLRMVAFATLDVAKSDFLNACLGGEVAITSDMFDQGFIQSC